MNKSKFWLILFAIIFCFGSIAWNIFDIVTYFMLEPQYRAPVFYLIFYFIDILIQIAIAVMLTYAIWNKGKYFRTRYRYYSISLVLSIVVSLFSVSTILLIISMFMSDWVWINPDKEEKNGKVVNIADTREEMITKLRRKRENGEISEEEFQQELMKLL